MSVGSTENGRGSVFETDAWTAPVSVGDGHKSLLVWLYVRRRKDYGRTGRKQLLPLEAEHRHIEQLAIVRVEGWNDKDERSEYGALVVQPAATGLRHYFHGV